MVIGRGRCGSSRRAQAGNSRLWNTGSLDQRISGPQVGKSAEVPVRRQQFPHAVGDAKCRNSRVVYQGPARLARSHEVAEGRPVLAAFVDDPKARGFPPCRDLIEGLIQRGRRRKDPRVRDYRNEFMDTRPWNGPTVATLGERSYAMRRLVVPLRIHAVGMDEDIGIDGDHVPRS